MKNPEVWRITVYGLVQGVGFRPFVAETAEELDIKGTVRNAGGIVIIDALGSADLLCVFESRIKNSPPPGAIVTSIEHQLLKISNVTNTDRFVIIESSGSRGEQRILPPDLPVCDNCKRELLDPANRRYRYPFISCVSCGPRYSIMHSVPYDRDSTSMDIFPMCPECAVEYKARGSIRRHAQTISCHSCGPQLIFETKKDQEHLEGDEALRKAIEYLKKGMIGAILDIGGFHFAFDPKSRSAALHLREWKHREGKPFAVLFPDMDSIRRFCSVSEAEEALLLSDARPIVLLAKREDAPAWPFEITAGSDRIGAMLPCNPLQILLTMETGPLVMTSGNRGGEPIITDPDEMRPLLEDCISFMLSHERKIMTPLDDSIYQINNGQVQILRRARGLVPLPIKLPFALKEDTIAEGGDLKSVFALARGDSAYLSAHYSDQDDIRAYESKLKGIEHMSAILDIYPQKAVCDKHPLYVSSRHATENFKSITKVQHHLAHTASVIAEKHLRGNIIGLSFDGTGYGDDGNIWGSEFWELYVDEEGRLVDHVKRASLYPLVMTGGDNASKDASLPLAAYLIDARERGYIDKSLFDAVSRGKIANIGLIESAITSNISCFVTSSMGRLFDAAAALLGIAAYNSYEGECPVKLEIAANRALNSRRGDQTESLLEARIISSDKLLYIDGSALIADIAKLLIKGYNADDIALAMHLALSKASLKISQMIKDEPFLPVPNTEGESHIALLSGGSFANRILFGSLRRSMEEKGFIVFGNNLVPPGDGGLALGQLYLSEYTHKNESRK
ncbi:carbamoyltransferase HypF [Butyrivibrio sp. MC2013]|uniref:carbamoyltransferase HypF n=1 Tax=Butyrivibrio sp. MC2013 TaxID=1280686 RepID=UPI000418EB3F|nr:carbamoyltransferase HypF [Butyrivibrio sp. MC2013]